MLAIRLQRVGRRGYAMYRMIVQDSKNHPKRGKVVAYVGSYNPHTKEAELDIETLNKYLESGAQPSERVVKILKDNKVSLPKWVEDYIEKTKSIKNTEKLRKNQPKEEAAEAEASDDTEVAEA